MDKNKNSILSVDKQHYAQLMAQNLPVLRTCLNLSQSELAEVIGVTRQTLSAAESGARELSWGNFISLLYVFTQNRKTVPLLETLGIYTEELRSLFQVTELPDMGTKNPNTKKAGEMR